MTYYRLLRQNGKFVGPRFNRYVDAFNWRAHNGLMDARIVERDV